MANDVPAVAAAVRIIEQLAAESPHAVSPGALAGDLGINRSTCYNILATLQRFGWVTSLGARAGWTLGPGLLAITGVSNESTRAVIQEELDVACRKLGYVAFTAQQDGSGGYTVTAVSDPRRGVRVIVDVGDRFPFSAPALMQSFYAFGPLDAFRQASRGRVIEQFTEHTVTGIDELAEVFARVRRQGYATSLGEFNLAQGAVAAPVFDAKAEVSMAVGTLAFSSQLDEFNVDETGRTLCDAAERITRRTGGQFPPPSTADGPDGVAETA